jgi:hypothetical protein
MRELSMLLLAVVTFSAACGRSEETQASRPADARAEAKADVKGCNLVTREDVAAALGGSVGDGEETGLAGCRWSAEDRGEVRLQVYAGSLFTPETCKAQKSLVSGRQEEISGLGDSALWGSSGDLVVCTQKAVLKIDVENTPGSPDQDRETLVKVARAALGRL